MKFMLVIVVALSASAVAAEPLSLQDAFKPPSFQSMRLSPDGKHIAAIGRANGATALLILHNLRGKVPYNRVARLLGLDAGILFL